jgi:hypothetical protein
MSDTRKDIALSQLDDLQSALELYRTAMNSKLSPDAKIQIYNEILRLYNFAFLTDSQVLGVR